MKSLTQTAAGGTLLVALCLGVPSGVVGAEMRGDVAQENLAQVFDPTLRAGALSRRDASMTRPEGLDAGPRIFDRYWAAGGQPTQPRVSFAAFEFEEEGRNIAQDNLDAVFKAQ